MDTRLGAGVGGLLDGTARMGTITQALNKDSQAQCGRQSLRDSLISRIQHAESRASEAYRLKRLADLFDKHPEVMEILELVRDSGLL